MECLPAAENPAGNWGEVVNGYQASLRLSKPQFAVGEPVTAILLLRNVSGVPRTFWVAKLPWEDFDVVVLDEARQRVPKRELDRFARSEGIHSSGLPAAGQSKSWLALSALLALDRPGSYSISVTTLMRGGTNGSTAVTSGTALFQIVQRPDPVRESGQTDPPRSEARPRETKLGRVAVSATEPPPAPHRLFSGVAPSSRDATPRPSIESSLATASPQPQPTFLTTRQWLALAAVFALLLWIGAILIRARNRKFPP